MPVIPLTAMDVGVWLLGSGAKPTDVRLVARYFDRFLGVIAAGGTMRALEAFFQRHVKDERVLGAILSNLPLVEDSAENDEHSIWQEGDIWWCDYPCPPGHDDLEEDGEYGEADYRRQLTGDERAVVLGEIQADAQPDPERLARGIAARNARFGKVYGGQAEAEALPRDYEIKSMAGITTTPPLEQTAEYMNRHCFASRAGDRCVTDFWQHGISAPHPIALPARSGQNGCNAPGGITRGGE